MKHVQVPPDGEALPLDPTPADDDPLLPHRSAVTKPPALERRGQKEIRPLLQDTRAMARAGRRGDRSAAPVMGLARKIKRNLIFLVNDVNLGAGRTNPLGRPVPCDQREADRVYSNLVML
jgi:hypothetical protein